LVIPLSRLIWGLPWVAESDPEDRTKMATIAMSAPRATMA